MYNLSTFGNLGDRYFYLNDHLGSARVVVGADGTVQDKYIYRAFGGEHSHSVTLDQAYRYTGKPFDEENGMDLYYYGARYYNPTLGRFTSIDKAGQYASGFVYGGNNPLMGTDPDGNLFFLSAPFLIGALWSGMTYTYDAAYAGSWDAGDFFLNAGIGGAGGLLSTWGHSHMPLLNIAEGAGQGYVMNGISNLANGGDFSDNAGLATGIGAAMGLVTSEHFYNLTKGEGWRSCDAVIRDLTVNQSWNDLEVYMSDAYDVNVSIVGYDPSEIMVAGTRANGDVVIGIDGLYLNGNVWTTPKNTIASALRHEEVHAGQYRALYAQKKALSTADAARAIRELETHNVQFSHISTDHLNRAAYKGSRANFANRYSRYVGGQLPGTGSNVYPWVFSKRYWWFF